MSDTQQSASANLPDPVASQQAAYDQWYDADYEERSRAWLLDASPAMEYLRNRRLHIGLSELRSLTGQNYVGWSALVVCGGVGAEGTFLADQGFGEVTVCDISEAALGIASRRDTRLKTTPGNAEALPFPDKSFDLVLVRDGLHHLPRPVQGLNEMLRVCRKAVIVCEPHSGWIPERLGTSWEVHGDSVNFVFRWDRKLFNQCVLSQWCQGSHGTTVRRVWDVPGVFSRILRFTGRQRLGLLIQRGMYGLLDFGLNFMASQMVAVAAREAQGRAREFSRRGKRTTHG
jgi:SAM-dependent methyltransferase